MDTKAAKRFQEHALQAIRELSAALLVARDSSSEREMLIIRKLTGEIIARIDGLLHESIHGDYPELRTLLLKR